MSRDYAKGRIAGINEAVARLALRECNLPMGEALEECGKCLLAVSALLPPLSEPPADAEVAQDAKPKHSIQDLRRLIESGQAFADNGDDLQRDLEIEAAERAVIEAAMVRWSDARVPLEEAVRLLDAACLKLETARQRSAAAKDPS